MNILDMIEWSSYIVEAALAALCAALCFTRAGKHKDASLFYYLLTGFYACVFMSDTYYFLAWLVEDYPYVFSAGDISWVGGIFFLITAAMDMMGEWTSEQKQAACKYRLPALIAPAVCVAFNAIYIAIYPEILINYLLYAVPTIILSYFTLWFYLAGKDGIGHGRRLYHLAVLIWISNQLIYDLFSTYTENYIFAVCAVICSCVLTLATTGVYFAARKGAAV